MLFKKESFSGGISTIELIVTIAIFVLITTSILVSYPQLSSQLSLEKTTQDVASTLHETRMYGIGVKSVGEVNPGTTRTKGYGVHFGGGDNKKYTLFSDGGTENHMYDVGEEVSDFVIRGTETIENVCVITAEDTSEDEMCKSNGVCLKDGVITSVDILFARPAPSVFINGFKDEESSCPGATEELKTCGRAVIIIKSPRGNCKKIEAWTTGQVSIQAKATQ